MTLRPTKAERTLPWAERPPRAREARSDQDQAIDILRFRVCETADNSGDRCIGKFSASAAVSARAGAGWASKKQQDDRRFSAVSAIPQQFPWLQSD